MSAWQATWPQLTHFSATSDASETGVTGALNGAIEVTEATGESDVDHARPILDHEVRDVSPKRTPTPQAATTVPGSAKTGTPTEGKTGNGSGEIVQNAVNVRNVQNVQNVVIVQNVVTVQTAAIADEGNLMIDLDATYSTSGLVVAAIANALNVLNGSGESVEKDVSGNEVHHLHGERNPHLT